MYGSLFRDGALNKAPINVYVKIVGPVFLTYRIPSFYIVKWLYTLWATGGPYSVLMVWV